MRGKTVRWVFVEVIDVMPLGNRLDRVEVSSRLHEGVTPKPIAFPRRWRLT